MRVAVHQPNYAPWCGYFAKMFASDAFVFLDDAQLPQGRSYVSRVKVARGQDADQWLTVPVRKGAKPIREVELAGEPWAEKHRRTLQHEYAKTPHLEEVLGREEASTLMEHLPPVGWADVATKRDIDHLGTTLGATLRAEWRHDMLQQTYVMITAMFGLAGVVIAAVKVLS